MESGSVHICQAPHEPGYMALTYISLLTTRRLAFVSLASAALSVGQVGERPQEGPSRESRAKISTSFTQKNLRLGQKWANSLPVSSLLLPLVVVVGRQVLGVEVQHNPP